MKDSSGRDITIDARILVDGMKGVVVACIDSNLFSVDYPAADWRYLKTGVLVDTAEAGLIHVTNGESLTLI